MTSAIPGKRGRPPKATGLRLTPVSFNIPPDVRDALDRQAIKERKSTSALLRDIVRAAIYRIEKIQDGEPGSTLVT